VETEVVEEVLLTETKLNLEVEAQEAVVVDLLIRKVHILVKMEVRE